MSTTPTVTPTATTPVMPEPTVPPGVDEPAEGARFLRPSMGDTLDFDPADDGYQPNFGKLKDDLDVPAFLRKQMD